MLLGLGLAPAVAELRRRHEAAGESGAGVISEAELEEQKARLLEEA